MRIGEAKDNRPENRALLEIDRKVRTRKRVSMMEVLSLLAGVAIAIVIIARPAKPYFKKPGVEQ